MVERKCQRLHVQRGRVVGYGRYQVFQLNDIIYHEGQHSYSVKET